MMGVEHIVVPTFDSMATPNRLLRLGAAVLLCVTPPIGYVESFALRIPVTFTRASSSLSLAQVSSCRRRRRRPLFPSCAAAAGAAGAAGWRCCSAKIAAQGGSAIEGSEQKKGSGVGQGLRSLSSSPASSFLRAVAEQDGGESARERAMMVIVVLPARKVDVAVPETRER